MPIRTDNNRNEPNPVNGELNVLGGRSIGDPRDHGLAGLRLLLDRVLQAVDGFTVDQFESAGVGLREVAQRRDQAIDLLERVVRYDGRRPDRRRHRSAALRLMGHLKATDRVGLLCEVATNERERPAQRAAAFDALGMTGDPDAAAFVAQFIHDGDDRIAARATWALGRLGGPDHLERLQAELATTEREHRVRQLADAVGTMGVRLGIPVAVPVRDRSRPRTVRTSAIAD